LLPVLGPANNHYILQISASTGVVSLRGDLVASTPNIGIWLNVSFDTD